MQSLGDIIPRVMAQNGRVPPPPDDPDEVERFLLDQPLLPAGRYASMLAYALDHPEDRTFDPRRLQRSLELAELRDRLLLGRPPGCWCYGLGGTHKRWIPMPDAEPEPVWEIYCTCPEAIAHHARRDQLHAQRERLIIQHAADRLFGSLPERFQKFSFEALLALSDAHRGVVDLARAWRIDRTRWSMTLRGPTGVGKTGIGVSTLVEAVADSQSALYVDVSDMLDQLRDSFGHGPQASEAFDENPTPHWKALFGIDLLLLDDLGPQQISDWALEQFWRLIGNRHRHERKTIVTSNHSLQELAKIYGHARIPGRLQEESLVIDCSELPFLRSP